MSFGAARSATPDDDGTLLDPQGVLSVAAQRCVKVNGEGASRTLGGRAAVRQLLDTALARG